MKYKIVSLSLLLSLHPLFADAETCFAGHSAGHNAQLMIFPANNPSFPEGHLENSNQEEQQVTYIDELSKHIFLIAGQSVLVAPKIEDNGDGHLRYKVEADEGVDVDLTELSERTGALERYAFFHHSKSNAKRAERVGGHIFLRGDKE